MYEDGKVYSHLSNKFLKGSINKFGYLEYVLFINRKQLRIKAHRLVAILFIGLPEDEECIIINHKDGNKQNNHYTNLEWCSYYYNNYHARVNKLNDISYSNSKRWTDPVFREKTREHFSQTHLKNGSNKGKLNGRFRYDIVDKNGKEYTRQELSELLNLSQSYTDVLIKRSADGKFNNYFEQYGICVKDTKKQS